MKQISIEQLQANQFYWARRRQLAGAPIGEPPELEVIRISTIFGSASEFWTVAVSGSEEHFDVGAFEYLHKFPPRLWPTAAVRIWRSFTQIPEHSNTDSIELCSRAGMQIVHCFLYHSLTITAR